MDNQKKKKPFYKRWWVWVLAVIFIIIIIPSESEEDSSSTPEVVQDTTAPTQIESEKLIPTDTDFQNYVLAIQSGVFPLIQLSNERILNAGELGSQLEIESAQLQIVSAKRFSTQAREAFSKLSPPEIAQNVHNFINQALNKYAEAIDIYEIGIAIMDVDIINRGSVLYQEGTDFLNKATAEFNKLQ